jgi:hypothetical protein
VKYTVILKRSAWLQEIFDYDDVELYVANPNIDFGSVQEAAACAKVEAAKADVGDVMGILADRGMALRDAEIDPDHYQVVLVFEGQPKIAAHGPQDLLVAGLNRGFEG